MARTRGSDRFSTELTVQMEATDLTATVLTTAGSPASPCLLVIDHDVPASAEIILFDGSFTGTSFVTTNLANRYQPGSAAGSGITHLVGAKVIFAALGSHHEEIHDELDAHEAATAVHGAVSTATANTIVARDASARFRAASPSNTADVTPRSYVDGADSTHAALTSPHSATSAATASRLVVRDASARAQFASPSASSDAATRGWVEGRTGIAVFTRATGDQSVANDTEVTWFCGNEAQDTIGVSQVTSGVVQCPAGLYIVVAQIGWDGNATGWRRAWIQHNGTSKIVDTFDAQSNIQVQNRPVLPISLANNDTINVVVRHTSGGNLNVRGDGAGSFTSELRIMKIG